jgi:hypothetical protein
MWGRCSGDDGTYRRTISKWRRSERSRMKLTYDITKSKMIDQDYAISQMYWVLPSLEYLEQWGYGVHCERYFETLDFQEPPLISTRLNINIISMTQRYTVRIGGPTSIRLLTGLKLLIGDSTITHKHCGVLQLMRLSKVICTETSTCHGFFVASSFSSARGSAQTQGGGAILASVIGLYLQGLLGASQGRMYTKKITRKWWFQCREYHW